MYIVNTSCLSVHNMSVSDNFTNGGTRQTNSKGHIYLNFADIKYHRDIRAYIYILILYIKDDIFPIPS